MYDSSSLPISLPTFVIVCPYDYSHPGGCYVDLFKRERTRAAPSDLAGVKTTPALLMVQLPVVLAGCVPASVEEKEAGNLHAPPARVPALVFMRSPPSHARSPLSHAVAQRNSSTEKFPY